MPAPPRIPNRGDEVSAVPCPWCGGTMIIRADKRGNPYSGCTHCFARCFANPVALEIAQERGRVATGSWPLELQPGLAWT